MLETQLQGRSQSKCSFSEINSGRKFIPEKKTASWISPTFYTNVHGSKVFMGSHGTESPPLTWIIWKPQSKGTSSRPGTGSLKHSRLRSVKGSGVCPWGCPDCWVQLVFHVPLSVSLQITTATGVRVKPVTCRTQKSHTSPQQPCPRYIYIMWLVD